MIVTHHVIVFLSCGFKRCSHTRVDNGVIHILKRRHMFPEKSSNSILYHKQSEKNNQLSVNHDFFSTSFHSLVPAGWNDFQSAENRKLALMGQKRKNVICFRFWPRWNGTTLEFRKIQIPSTKICTNQNVTFNSSRKLNFGLTSTVLHSLYDNDC